MPFKDRVVINSHIQCADFNERSLFHSSEVIEIQMERDKKKKCMKSHTVPPANCTGVPSRVFFFLMTISSEIN